MTAEERKGTPVFSGVLNYFPDAIREVARTSYLGNVQHNPGCDLFWDRSKSGDELDALTRHLLQAGTLDTDGIRHSAKVAWRALANLQKEIEEDNLIGYQESIIEESKEDDTMYPSPCVAYDSVSEETVTAEEMLLRSEELKADVAALRIAEERSEEHLETLRERRMNLIGQNGNDGEHYDELTYLNSKTQWADKEEIQKMQQGANAGGTITRTDEV